jgi:membrane fusion protein (multidrug efflux system)
MNEKKKKNSFRVYIPLIIVVLLVGTGIGYWYNEYSKYISTDDAHVDTDNVSVSSKMLGRITEVFAEEGDNVEAGELLAVLDSSDLQSQKTSAMAVIEQVKATLKQVEAKYNFDKENIKVLEVSQKKAKQDFERAKLQFDGGIITREQFEHAEIATETADATLNAAKSQLEVSQAAIKSTHASVESAEAQVQVIETQLKNTRLYAPISGIIAKRWLLPGDIVQPGQSVFTVTNDDKLWIAVYLEETKIAGVHNGQQTNFTIDAFPGVDFTGKVYSIGSNTASQFSLIPPNNASGNFTKVTQRVPLKISIDGVLNGGDLSSYKVLAGMSAVVKIVKEQK